MPPRQRGKYISYFAGLFAFAGVVGPLFGGLFTDHLTWRWAFWINIPVAVVVLVVAMTAIPALGRTPGAPRPVIDTAGIVFIGLAASGLTLATSWGGTEYPWTSPTILAQSKIHLESPAFLRV